ncbi:alpha/beta hydrolase [Salinibacterium sp. G-O1]|uniref:alpha/beta hydrolase n=1 Tax=Salinibacterium sp. G-O1 TaxID=3046208 RepID=UPI0024BA1BE8|nr:alpha/beta hydrolase [Salinibacterium sp. G-O1]MDJ0336207.1 alpha/beta hydrolase [Salinibacterium sp. G-O1]
MSDPSTWQHVFEDGEGPVLLALHGTGGNERDILPLAHAVDPMTAVLAPRGQVSEGGALRWFRRLAEGVFDVDDVVVRAGDLADFVEWAVERYALQGRRIVAVGFSNGANVGLATAALYPQVVPEVIAFSGMYPFAGRPLTDRLDGSRMLLANGSHDPMAPATSVTRLTTQLREQGAQVTRHKRAGGHGIDAEDLDAARRWLGLASSRG